MTQIITKTRPAATALLTLADNTILDMMNTMVTLADPAFLFEFKASGSFYAGTLTQLVQGGDVICLVRSDIDGADLDSELAPDQITRLETGDYEKHQRIFAVAEWEYASQDANVFVWNWKIHFKPKSKGGIPFSQGSGWKLVIINRQGGAQSTGDFVTTESIMTRYAWGGF